MPAPQNAESSNKPVRVCRTLGGKQVIEGDWKLSRIEPESGNAIVERGGKTLAVDRNIYEKLNFPGSDKVWGVLSVPHEEADLAAARKSWTQLDLAGVMAALVRHARDLDPVLIGVQTVADLEKKIEEIADTCIRSMDILRLEVRRVEDEYNRCPSRTSFDNDQKDTLLARFQHLEDQFSTRKYRCETLVPEWQRLVTAIRSLEAAQKNSK